MRTPVCRLCGGGVLHGNLYCSQACGQADKAKDAVHASTLKQQGFVVDPEIPNVFLKDGVATTLEAVKHVGLEKALRHHEHAVSARNSVSPAV